MVLESGILVVKKGQEQAFEKDFKEASKFISAAKGYVRHQLQKCIEQPNKYLLLVEWETLEKPYGRFQGIRRLPAMQSHVASLLPLFSGSGVFRKGS